MSQKRTPRPNVDKMSSKDVVTKTKRVNLDVALQAFSLWSGGEPPDHYKYEQTTLQKFHLSGSVGGKIADVDVSWPEGQEQYGFVEVTWLSSEQSGKQMTRKYACFKVGSHVHVREWYRLSELIQYQYRYGLELPNGIRHPDWPWFENLMRVFSPWFLGSLLGLLAGFTLLFGLPDTLWIKVGGEFLPRSERVFFALYGGATGIGAFVGVLFACIHHKLRGGTLRQEKIELWRRDLEKRSKNSKKEDQATAA